MWENFRNIRKLKKKFVFAAANTENMQDAAFAARRGASHFPSLQAGAFDRLAFRRYFY